MSPSLLPRSAPIAWTCILLVAIGATGCATVSPRDALATLDTRSPLYKTDECQRARKVAERFEGRDLARGGAGLAAGVVVGVVAAPIMGVLEADAISKKEAVVMWGCGAVLALSCATLGSVAWWYQPRL